jgi:hypothetical protein
MVDWESVRYIIENEGIDSLTKEGIYYARKSLNRFSNRNKKGEHVYDKEWDFLIVIDACRVDLINEVKEDYDFIDEVDSIYSVGSQSLEWMQNTFERESEDISYITSNMFTSKMDSSTKSTIGRLEEIWEDYWNERYGVTLPRHVSNEVIRQNRKGEEEKVIAHYMQPHEPFLSPVNTGSFFENNKDFKEEVENWGQRKGGKPIWEHLRDGDVSYDSVWEDYKRNLRIVLNNIEILLENVEFDNVVITSDHGNAMGENGIYGHPYGVHTESIRRVPWIKVGSTEDKNSIDTPNKNKKENNITVDEKLEALGYV